MQSLDGKLNTLEIKMQFVLSKFMVKRLASDQALNLANSLLESRIKDISELFSKVSVQSSANNVGVKLLEILVISVVYAKWRNGLRVDPCGKPILVVLMEDFTPLR